MKDDDTSIVLLLRVADPFECARKRNKWEREVRLPTFSTSTLAPKPDEEFDYSTPQYRKAKCTHTTRSAAQCLRRTDPGRINDKCLCACHRDDYEAL